MDWIIFVSNEILQYFNEYDSFDYKYKFSNSIESSTYDNPSNSGVKNDVTR